MKLTLALATLAAMAIALPAVFPPPRAHTDHHPQGFQELRALNATNGSTVGVEKVGGTGVIERATMEAAGNKTCPPTYSESKTYRTFIVDQFTDGICSPGHCRRCEEEDCVYEGRGEAAGGVGRA